MTTTTNISAGTAWSDGSRIVCTVRCFVLREGFVLVSGLDDAGGARVISADDLARNFTPITGRAP